MNVSAQVQERHSRQPMAAARGMTSAALIHQALRGQIIAMRLVPGARIVEADVAASFGVSRTPVREALLRLVDEGLVEIAARSSIHVARIPAALLPDAIFVRSAVENATARAAAVLGRGSSVMLLRGTIEVQRECLREADSNGFHEADEAFHAELAVAAGRPYAWSLVQQAKAQLDRYRRLTLPEARRMERVVDEHTAIVDAVAAGDPAAAAAAMDRHLDGLRQSLAAICDLNPDYFAGDANGLVAAFKTLSLR